MEKRKNIALRAATVLCVLVLFCAAFVGGTFAKYTTNDDANDSARVAKWGIAVVASGSLFGADYLAGATADSKITATASTSVSALDDANIVAPGTTSDKGLTIKLSGTPEVQYAITAGVNSADIQDIYLGAGTWGTMVQLNGITADNYQKGTYYLRTGTDASDYTYTKEAADSTFSDSAVYYELHDSVTLDAAYYPILWSVAADGVDGTEDQTDVRNLVDVAAALRNAINADAGNAENVLDATYTLSWKWVFTGGEQNDGADTILGNLIAADAAADVVILDGANYVQPTARADASNLNDYNLNVVFGIDVVVEQVDG